MAIVVSKEEISERINRHKKFTELLNKFNIKTSKLSLVTGIRENNLSSMKTRKVPITEETFKVLIDGIVELIRSEDFKVKKPNVEVEGFDYVVQLLKLHGNTLVKKSKIKDVGKYLDDLRLNGFDCKIDTDRDGDYVVTDINQHRQMVEKIIQPTKPKVEEDTSVISKVRKMHEDALVLHKKALKLKESTEQIVNSVDEVSSKLAQATQKDVDKLVPGLREGMPAFNKMLHEMFPDDSEKIEITDEDILEAVEHNKKLFRLPPAEEVELKELAEEQLVKCGLSKQSKEDSFINFLKDRFSHEEIKGFIRGITILSVLDEDYQKASYFIDYFINQGYAPEEMRL